MPGAATHRPRGSSAAAGGTRGRAAPLRGRGAGAPSARPSVTRHPSCASLQAVARVPGRRAAQLGEGAARQRRASATGPWPATRPGRVAAGAVAAGDADAAPSSSKVRPPDEPKLLSERGSWSSRRWTGPHPARAPRDGSRRGRAVDGEASGSGRRRAGGRRRAETPGLRVEVVRGDVPRGEPAAGMLEHVHAGERRGNRSRYFWSPSLPSSQRDSTTRCSGRATSAARRGRSRRAGRSATRRCTCRRRPLCAMLGRVAVRDDQHGRRRPARRRAAAGRRRTAGRRRGR